MVSLPAAAQAPRLALTIGNGGYAGLPPLPGCALSARAVASALGRAGFEVTERQDLSNARMGAAIADFADALAKTPNAAAVIYICGYAASLDGRMFLLPVSATLERETDVLTQGVVGRLAVNAVFGSDVAAGLVLLDMVGRPGVPVRLEAVLPPAPAPRAALAAYLSASTASQGPTPLSAALAATLAGRDVEAGAVVRDVRTMLGTVSAATFAAVEPARPAWLLGGSVPEPPGPALAPPSIAPAAPAPVPPATPPALAALPPAAPLPASPEADRRRVQLALQRLGYYSGRVDGAFGAETTAAVRRFQHELGAEMTGRLTPEQTARLLLDGR